MPGLDGLRALAVLALLALGADAAWTPGWGLGLGVCLAIAGYVIADSLLERWVAGDAGRSGRRARLHPRLALVSIGVAMTAAALGAGAPVGCAAGGVALGMVWPSRRLGVAADPSALRLLDGVGIAAAAMIVALGWRSGFGAAALTTLASAALIAAAAHRATRLGRALRWRPAPGWLPWSPGPRWSMIAAAALGVAALALFGRGDATPADREADLPGSLTALSSESVATAQAAPQRNEVEQRESAPAPDRDHAGAAGAPLRTSCDAVVHVGDSTSDGLVSPDYLPRAKDRIDAQYARYGATRSRMEIEGATSIVESPDGTSAADAAGAVVDGGYRGCWVVALGTNETANVSAGSAVGLGERIDRMMSVIGSRPTLWLTVRTLNVGGPYADQNMRAFNEALLEACDSYPNLRVFDWAATVKDEWFIDDGIHFTSDGYAARAHRTARALAEAFPRDRAPYAGCLVS